MVRDLKQLLKDITTFLRRGYAAGELLCEQEFDDLQPDIPQYSLADLTRAKDWLSAVGLNVAIVPNRSHKALSVRADVGVTLFESKGHDLPLPILKAVKESRLIAITKVRATDRNTSVSYKIHCRTGWFVKTYEAVDCPSEAKTLLEAQPSGKIMLNSALAQCLVSRISALIFEPAPKVDVSKFIQDKEVQALLVDIAKELPRIANGERRVPPQRFAIGFNLATAIIETEEDLMAALAACLLVERDASEVIIKIKGVDTAKRIQILEKCVFKRSADGKYLGLDILPELAAGTLDIVTETPYRSVRPNDPVLHDAIRYVNPNRRHLLLDRRDAQGRRQGWAFPGGITSDNPDETPAFRRQDAAIKASEAKLKSPEAATAPLSSFADELRNIQTLATNVADTSYLIRVQPNLETLDKLFANKRIDKEIHDYLKQMVIPHLSPDNLKSPGQLGCVFSNTHSVVMSSDKVFKVAPYDQVSSAPQRGGVKFQPTYVTSLEFLLGQQYYFQHEYFELALLSFYKNDVDSKPDVFKAYLRQAMHHTMQLMLADVLAGQFPDQVRSTWLAEQIFAEWFKHARIDFSKYIVDHPLFDANHYAAQFGMAKEDLLAFSGELEQIGRRYEPFMVLKIKEYQAKALLSSDIIFGVDKASENVLDVPELLKDGTVTCELFKSTDVLMLTPSRATQDGVYRQADIALMNHKSPLIREQWNSRTQYYRYEKLMDYIKNPTSFDAFLTLCCDDITGQVMQDPVRVIYYNKSVDPNTVDVVICDRSSCGTEQLLGSHYAAILQRLNVPATLAANQEVRIVPFDTLKDFIATSQEILKRRQEFTEATLPLLPTIQELFAADRPVSKAVHSVSYCQAAFASGDRPTAEELAEVMLLQKVLLVPAKDKGVSALSTANAYDVYYRPQRGSETRVLHVDSQTNADVFAVLQQSFVSQQTWPQAWHQLSERIVQQGGCYPGHALSRPLPRDFALTELAELDANREIQHYKFNIGFNLEEAIPHINSAGALVAALMACVIESPQGIIGVDVAKQSALMDLAVIQRDDFGRIVGTNFFKPIKAGTLLAITHTFRKTDLRKDIGDTYAVSDGVRLETGEKGLPADFRCLVLERFTKDGYSGLAIPGGRDIEGVYGVGHGPAIAKFQEKVAAACGGPVVLSDEQRSQIQPSVIGMPDKAFFSNHWRPGATELALQERERRLDPRILAYYRSLPQTADSKSRKELSLTLGTHVRLDVTSDVIEQWVGKWDKKSIPSCKGEEVKFRARLAHPIDVLNPGSWKSTCALSGSILPAMYAELCRVNRTSVIAAAVFAKYIGAASEAIVGFMLRDLGYDVLTGGWLAIAKLPVQVDLAWLTEDILSTWWHYASLDLSQLYLTGMNPEQIGVCERAKQKSYDDLATMLVERINIIKQHAVTYSSTILRNAPQQKQIIRPAPAASPADVDAAARVAAPVIATSFSTMELIEISHILAQREIVAEFSGDPGVARYITQTVLLKKFCELKSDSLKFEDLHREMQAEPNHLSPAQQLKVLHILYVIYNKHLPPLAEQGQAGVLGVQTSPEKLREKSITSLVTLYKSIVSQNRGDSVVFIVKEHQQNSDSFFYDRRLLSSRFKNEHGQPEDLFAPLRTIIATTVAVDQEVQKCLDSILTPAVKQAVRVTGKLPIDRIFNVAINAASLIPARQLRLLDGLYTAYLALLGEPVEIEQKREATDLFCDDGDDDPRKVRTPKVIQGQIRRLIDKYHAICSQYHTTDEAVRNVLSRDIALISQECACLLGLFRERVQSHQASDEAISSAATARIKDVIDGLPALKVTVVASLQKTMPLTTTLLGVVPGFVPVNPFLSPSEGSQPVTVPTAAPVVQGFGHNNSGAVLSSVAASSNVNTTTAVLASLAGVSVPAADSLPSVSPTAPVPQSSVLPSGPLGGSGYSPSQFPSAELTGSLGAPGNGGIDVFVRAIASTGKLPVARTFNVNLNKLSPAGCLMALQDIYLAYGQCGKTASAEDIGRLVGKYKEVYERSKDTADVVKVFDNHRNLDLAADDCLFSKFREGYPELVPNVGFSPM